MQPVKKWVFILNIVGGVLVLVSYGAGFMVQGDTPNLLWGGVPHVLRPLYTVNMLLAAVGYLVFTSYLLFNVDSNSLRVFGRYRFGIFNILYAVILFPSAMWLPLTMSALAGGGLLISSGIRLVLWLVALASLIMFAALIFHHPQGNRRFRQAALAGAVFFCLQTILLDAVIWNLYFP